MDRQTRIGIGAGAVFALVSCFAPFLGLLISGPILFFCGVAAIWGLWPLAYFLFPSKKAIVGYWSGGAKRHALLLGFLLLGIGIGGLINSNNYAVWNAPPSTGRIVWNFEETASGRGYFLNMQKPSGQEPRIVGFGAHGKNNSSEPINDFDAYLRSDTTNETLPIYIVAAEASAANVCTMALPTLPKDTLGIPAFADFDIVSYGKPFPINVLNADAMPLSKFLNEFVPFTVVMKYDGKDYERHFSKEEVDRQIALLEKLTAPITTPHVVKKSAPTIAPPPPLATPIPPSATASPSNPDITGKIPTK